jgi:hypothetical protein
MPDEIRPALDPEEWARLHHWVQCYDSWSDEQSEKTGVGEISAGPDYLTLTSHQHGEIADFSAPTDRHALAALALHGMPFGFTRQDVAALDALLEMAYDAFGGSKSGTEGDPDWQRGKALRAKLHALLPQN